MDSIFTITKAAAARIKQLAAGNNADSKLRIDVLGGGCSGFQYDIHLDKNVTDMDLSFSNGEAIVVIHKDCMPMLNNSSLDYIEDLGEAKFEIINPNASAKCGCGKSFGMTF